MLWLPRASAVVENVATPLTSVPVPSVVSPSLNVTVPVAVLGATVALKVTGPPNTEPTNGASVVVVGAMATAGDSALDVLVV
jgi:hypothetical protein